MTTVLEAPRTTSTRITTRPSTPSVKPLPGTWFTMTTILFFLKGESIIQATRGLNIYRNPTKEDELRRLLERNCPRGVTPKRFLVDMHPWLRSSATTYPCRTFGPMSATTARQRCYTTWMYQLREQYGPMVEIRLNAA